MQRIHKKYLIVADFPTRLKFYNAAIKKTSANNRCVMILVPDLALIPYFIKSIKSPMAILHSSMTKTERWVIWNKIRENKFKITIGSQSALFAPVKSLGLIIIDQEENDTFKNDRSPRFHAVKVASKLADFSKANLILGSTSPRLETYYQATQGEFAILSPRETPDNVKIKIIDMNPERYNISNSLEKEIEECLKNKKRVLLVLNRKGEGTKFSCTDCNWIAVCEKCGLPLIPQKAENVCFRCEKKFPQPMICPKCASIRLKPMGLGTARLKKFLIELFPQAKIIQVEKEIDGRHVSSEWDIAITTAYGLKFPWPKIGLVGIIDADQGLNFPDFSSPEKVFQIFFKFLRIGERGIVQTNLPQNYIIRDLAHLNYKRFFLDELNQRRKFNFPPYSRLTRLLFKSVEKEEILKETSRVYNLLSSQITKNHIPVTISNPHTCFIAKERGKFRWQIIIKSSKDISHFPSLISIIRSLPSGWIIDVDPINLL